MTLLPWAKKRHTNGWNEGVIEDAEPDVSVDSSGGMRGILASAVNFVISPAGKLAVRGGSRIVRSFTDSSTAAISAMLTIWPFSPVGAVVVGWSESLSKHFLWRLDADMAFYTGVEGTSRIDLTAAPSAAWGTAQGRPILAELFEKLYVCDANTTYGSRHTLLAIDSTGVVQQPSFDFGGGAEALRPYCVEEWNNVLFIAGYGNKTDPNNPETVRHSFLGRDPAAADGFDKNAYNIVGAKGQRVTAMKGGKTVLLISKDNELYRVTGNGQGRAGWQYTTMPLADSEGLGASNPLALDHADPYWYGLGKGGPFRCNGTTVERLDLPRFRSWPTVINLDKSFVSYHQARNVVLFGLYQAPADVGYAGGFPYRVWVWDIARECWIGDWKLPIGAFYIKAISTTTSPAPGAMPGLPVVTNTLAGLTTIRITFTPGDATSATEVWAAPYDGGAYFRVGAQPAGAGPFNYDLTGLNPSTHYKIKLRHEKNGLYTDYTAEVEGWTLLEAPPVPEAFASDSFHHVDLTVFCSVVDADLQVYRGMGSVLIQTIANPGIGSTNTNDYTIPCFTTSLYWTRHFKSSWPVGIQLSAASPSSDGVVACSVDAP